MQFLQGQQLVCWRLGYILLHAPCMHVRHGTWWPWLCRLDWLLSPTVGVVRLQHRYIHRPAAVMVYNPLSEPGFLVLDD